jgi:hypothetical protein
MRLSLRGIGVPIVIPYLIDLGGVETAPGLVVGQGWQARVWKGEPFQLHALRVGVTELEFGGDEAVVEQVVAAFQKKAIRAGG